MIQVLLVEDDQGVSDLVGYILESDLGAAVCFATTGRVAVDAMEFGAFDLAIIDLTVSGLSGFDLAKRAVDRFIPSLLCSGLPNAIATLAEFHFPYLAKPFKPSDLIVQSTRIITRPAQNLRRFNASYARLQGTIDGQSAYIAESRRSIEESQAARAARRKSPLWTGLA
jgi:DNA-binding NtrC family response regulator